MATDAALKPHTHSPSMTGLESVPDRRMKLNGLLAFAVDAHGGPARWDAFSGLRAELSIDGAIWHVKQQPGLLKNKVLEIDTHAERLSITPFSTPRHRSVFVPDCLTLETLDGEVCEMRNDPDTAFEGDRKSTRLNSSH